LQMEGTLTTLRILTATFDASKMWQTMVSQERKIQ
jgi:hypothetical protein